MDYYVAIDIGASSGRHIAGWIEDGIMKIKEVYRFENGMTEMDGHLCWNPEQLFADICAGLKACKEAGMIPKSIAIDTWGVDFALLDKEGQRIGNMVGYRDHRTDDSKAWLDEIMSETERYKKTGIAEQLFNTLYQMAALKKDASDELARADCMLMIPDYYQYLLTGQMMQEYTNATTSQMVDVRTKNWDYSLIRSYGFPERLFRTLSHPGTTVGRLLPQVEQEIGFSCVVRMAPSHDTASAVMAVPSLEQESLFISSGTWSLMGILSDTCNTGREMQQSGFTNEGGYGGQYTILKNIMGLWMIQSLRRELAPNLSFAEIVSLAEDSEVESVVDCNDNSFLSPDSMTEAVQEYCRKTGQKVPEGIGQLSAVVYKSLARCYVQAKKELEGINAKTYDHIFVIGGGSQAEYLNRLTAEYTGCKVTAGPTEATAIGNIVSQMIADGVFADLREARKCIMNSFEIKEYS